VSKANRGPLRVCLRGRGDGGATKPRIGVGNGFLGCPCCELDPLTFKRGCHCRQNFSNRAANDQVGQGVDRGFVAVNDDELCAALFGDDRQIGRWGYDQRRADGEHHLCGLGPVCSLLKHVGWQRLTKRNGGMFEPAFACRAWWSAVLACELLHEGVDVETGSAVKTGGLACRAVEFQNVLIAGQLMEPVNVLGDHTADPVFTFPRGKREMPDTGLGCGKVGVAFTFLPPVLVSGLGTGQELVVVDGPVFRPHTTGRAEVGNAALGANSGTGEHNRPMGGSQPGGSLFNRVCFKGHQFCLCPVKNLVESRARIQAKKFRQSSIENSSSVQPGMVGGPADCFDGCSEPGTDR